MSGCQHRLQTFTLYVAAFYIYLYRLFRTAAIYYFEVNLTGFGICGRTIIELRQLVFAVSERRDTFAFDRNYFVAYMVGKHTLCVIRR